MDQPQLVVIGTDFRIEVDIAAPPETVWAAISDVERWHEWTPSVRGIRLFGKRPLDVGSRALVRQPRFLPALWKVTAIEPGRSFTWETKSPGLHVHAIHGVEPIPGGAHATLKLRYGGALGRWLAEWTRETTSQYLELEAAGLKRRSEKPPMV